MYCCEWRRKLRRIDRGTQEVYEELWIRSIGELSTLENLVDFICFHFIFLFNKI